MTESPVKVTENKEELTDISKDIIVPEVLINSDDKIEQEELPKIGKVEKKEYDEYVDENCQIVRGLSLHE